MNALDVGQIEQTSVKDYDSNARSKPISRDEQESSLKPEKVMTEAERRRYEKK